MYIVNREKYYGYYAKGIRKIIPGGLIPLSRPRILDWIYDLNGQNIGLIGGILLRETDMEKTKMLDRLIEGINTLKQPNTHSLALDGLYLLNDEDIWNIEKETKLRVMDGRKLATAYLRPLLKDIYKTLKKELREEEVLILGNRWDLTKNIIQSICTKVRFITIAGEYDNNRGDLAEEILEETGLSIFCSKDIDGILSNYSIIINLHENPKIDINKIGKKVIIFDFSISKPINKLMRDNRKTKAIEDVWFSNALSISKTQWLGELIPSYVYEYFYPEEAMTIEKLIIGGDMLSIKDYTNSYLRDSGEL